MTQMSETRCFWNQAQHILLEPSGPRSNSFAPKPRSSDVVRPSSPEGYTFWDYKQGKFAKDQGLRIDFLYGSSEITDRVVDVAIHREERTRESPSDHVPVSVEIDDLGDGDDRPMVF